MIPMIHIDVKTVIEGRLAESMGFEKYRYIMENVRKTDVSKDADFQRTFNGFYRVRRDEDWRTKYYRLFEEVKESRPTFETILRSLNELTGTIETSFSSKMLATLDADMPIWDKYVAGNLELELTGKTKEEKLACAVEQHAHMVEWYRDFLKSDNGKECIAEFDRIMPGYTWMSEVKKIDFFLWSMRE